MNPGYPYDGPDGTPEGVYGPLETPQVHAREIVRYLELLQAAASSSAEGAARGPTAAHYDINTC